MWTRASCNVMMPDEPGDDRTEEDSACIDDILASPDRN
jgi:hypothetical protein